LILTPLPNSTFKKLLTKSISNDNPAGIVRTENAHNMAPREFFRSCLDSNFYFIMKNFQTIILSSRDNHHEANSDDFNQAIQRLKDCTILGLVERFDESMVLAEEILRDCFIGILF